MCWFGFWVWASKTQSSELRGEMCWWEHMGVMGIARKPKNVSWHGLHSKNLVLESDSQQLWGLGGTRPWNLTRGAATCCMLPPPPRAPHQLATVHAPAFLSSVASVPVLFQLVTTPLASVQLCRHFPAFFQFLGDQFLSPFLPSSDPIKT